MSDSYRDAIVDYLREIVRLRRDFGGHKVKLSVSIVQPMCIGCVNSWRWLFPELQGRDWPDIGGEGWPVDLLLLGFDSSSIFEMELAVSEGIDVEERGPFCYDCNRPLPYWEDEDSACYVVVESLEDYIGHQQQLGAMNVGKKLKEAIVRAYGSECFGCGRDLKRSDVTIDHIIPKSQGGGADYFNLQPLCQSCNQEKADQVPLEKTATLHFPLRPLPIGAYERPFW